MASSAEAGQACSWDSASSAAEGTPGSRRDNEIPADRINFRLSLATPSPTSGHLPDCRRIPVEGASAGTTGRSASAHCPYHFVGSSYLLNKIAIVVAATGIRRPGFNSCIFGVMRIGGSSFGTPALAAVVTAPTFNPCCSSADWTVPLSFDY